MKILNRLGLVTKDDLEDFEYSIDEISKDLSKLRYEEMLQDHGELYKEAVEINHRLKKLEEYLGVEYYSETSVKSGYRKKKK